MALFRNIPVAVMLVQNFLFGAVYYAYLYYLPLYYQNVRDMSPLLSAVLTIPIVFCQSFFSILTGLYISHYKRYGEVIWAGFILWTIGSSLLTLFDRTLHIAAVVVISGIVGTAVGFIFQPTLVAMQAHCSKAQRAVVISNRNFLRSLGGAFGLAISAAVLQNSLKGALPAGFKSLADSTYTSPDYDQYSAADSEAIHDAYAKASRTVFIVLAPFVAVCLFGCFLVKDRGLTQPEDGDKPGEGAATDATVTQVGAEEEEDDEKEKDHEKQGETPRASVTVAPEVEETTTTTPTHAQQAEAREKSEK